MYVEKAYKFIQHPERAELYVHCHYYIINYISNMYFFFLICFWSLEGVERERSSVDQFKVVLILTVLYGEKTDTKMIYMV